MIRLVEGAERQKTPNEIALHIPGRPDLIFVFAMATIPSYVTCAEGAVSVMILVALFVTLSLPKSRFRAYRWCSPPRIGYATMSPNLSIGRVQGVSFPSET
jgi:hypothetical protein